MPAAPPHQRYRRASSRTSRAFQRAGSSGRHRVGTSISRGGPDDTQNIWRVTVDPLTEKWVDGPERLTTGAGEETNVAISPDGTRLVFTTTSSRTRLWAFPFDSAQRAASPANRIRLRNGSTGEVDFDARADGSKVAYRTVRAGRNELWERSLTRRAASGCCCRARTGES